MLIPRYLVLALGFRKARAFEKIQNQRGLVAKRLTGLACGVDVLAFQRRIFRNLLLGVPRHERIIEAPPCRPQQRHPDQLALQEEFEERRLASKRPQDRKSTRLNSSH